MTDKIRANPIPAGAVHKIEDEEYHDEDSHCVDPSRALDEASHRLAVPAI